MSRTFGTPNKRRPIYRFWWISDDFKKRNQSAVWELSWNMPNTTPATLILNIYIYMQEIWTWILHDLNVWHFLLAWSWSCNFATSFSMLLYITFFFHWYDHRWCWTVSATMTTSPNPWASWRKAADLWRLAPWSTVTQIQRGHPRGKALVSWCFV